MTALPDSADFAILTIIGAELEAVKNTFDLEGPVEHKGRIFYHGKVAGPNGKEYSIVCTKSRDYGNTAATAAAMDVLTIIIPKFFLLVGIAGGVKGKKDLQLGDVVISDDIEYYELEKESGEERLDRSGKLANPSMLLLNKCEIVKSINWQNEIKEKKPSDITILPKATAGLILSGDKLLGDPDSPRLKSLLKKYDRALAVEMEGGGFARAVLEKSIPKQKDHLVIRGISDFCNEKDNQKSRTKWRKYAAYSAATFAKKLIENIEIEDARKSPHEVYLSDYQNSISSKPNIEFSLKIKTPDKTISADSFNNFLLNSRRVVLKGSPGTGKSSVVIRLSRYLIGKKIVPVFIDLKRWRRGYSDELKNNSLSTEEKLDIIMKSSVVPITLQKIKSFNKEICFIVDGLNEITGGEFGQETPQMIMEVVRDYIRNNYDTTIGLVTDRMQHRSFLDDWKKAEMILLEEEEVKTIIDEQFRKNSFDVLDEINKDLLAVPYYLNYALNTDSPKLASESIAHERFFTVQMGFKDQEVDLLAELLFQETKDYGLSFRLENFEKMGQDNIAKIKESGILKIRNGGQYTFDHQLKHDYLLSRNLARNPKKWNGYDFDIVSLESNSLESIYMTFEQIKDTESGDKFLLEVYDWNLQAAIKSIQHANKMHIKNSSDKLILAILALVALKKFDPSRHTSINAQNSLIDFGITPAQELVKVNNLKEIIHIIDQHGSGSKPFEKWKVLFTKDRGSTISEEDVNMILSDNSLIGWTASNVLHECILSDSNQLQVRTIYKASKDSSHKSNVTRWRSVHVLGSNPSQNNVKLLIDALENDPYHWVRYGAARSLVEIAAITEDSELRKLILEKIKMILHELKQNIVDEIGNTIFYRKAKGSWQEDALAMLEKIKDLKEDDAYKEKWEKKIMEFKEGKWKN